MEKIVTTLLDVLGLLLVAAGAYFVGVEHLRIGHSALLLAGVVVLAGSALAAREPSGQPPVWPRLVAWVKAWRDRRRDARA